MSDDEYYTIRSAGLGDVPLRSRPRPLRAALLFATATFAVTAMLVPELLDREPRAQWSRVAANERAPLLDDRAVGSIDRTERPRWMLGGNSSSLRTRTTQREAPARGGSTYVVRRSVLSQGSVCVIRQDGTRTGSC